MSWDDEREVRAGILESIVNAADEKFGDQWWETIGVISVAPPLHDDTDNRRLQIRSEPVQSFGGGELRFDATLEELDDASTLMERLVESPSAVTSARTGVALSVAEARQIVGERLTEIAATPFPVALHAIGIRAAPTLLACFDVFVELEIIGHGLTPVIERLDVLGTGHLETELDRLLSSHLRRADMLTRCRAIGARGMVEVPALLAMAWSVMDTHVMLTHLERSNLLCFDYWTEDGAARARLSWREGLLKGDFFNYGNRTDLIDGVLTVQRQLSSKILEKRQGRPIGKLVQDVHLPGETRMISAKRGIGITELVLEIPSEPLLIWSPFRGPDQIATLTSTGPDPKLSIPTPHGNNSALSHGGWPIVARTSSKGSR